jgi:hypothetical protein
VLLGVADADPAGDLGNLDALAVARLPHSGQGTL